jgi:hypothetical protein
MSVSHSCVLAAASTLAFAALVLMAPASAVSRSDPYAGLWTLNLDKSGGESRSQVLTIRVNDGVETYRSELVLRDGTRQVTNYTAAYDGKEHPSETVVTAPNGALTRRDDTVTLRRIDQLTRERQWRRDGRLIRILRRTVSQDGRTLTSQIIDVDEDGHEHPGATLVFDKVESRH